MDYIFQDNKQNFQEELSYLFETEVEQVSDTMCRKFNQMGYLFEKEDIRDVLENNQKYIKKRLTRKLESRDKKSFKHYRKQLRNK